PPHMAGQQGYGAAWLDAHGFYQLYVLMFHHGVAFRAMLAVFSRRAFHRHSCHSCSGTESCTMPPPTPKIPCRASCISMLRMATFSEQSPSGASQPMLPQ